MFKHEESFSFKKMHELSPADGFAKISENLADMIKFVANEPSTGLFYVQQHTQKAVPNLVHLKNNVVEKSHETTLQTEDLEDSITMLDSMKECGSPIVDEMMKEIKNSLSIMSTKRPKRGLLQSSSSGFLGRASSWSPASWGSNKVYSLSDAEKGSGYFSSVMKSAKQRAGGFKWSQVKPIEESKSKGESSMFDPGPAYPSAGNSISSSMAEPEAGNFPFSSETSFELQEESELGNSLSHQQLLSLGETYNEFRAEKEAKFEEWLGGMADEKYYGGKTSSSKDTPHEDLGR